MVELIIWLLYIAGVTIIITESGIFKPLRDFLDEKNPKFLGKIVKCPLCLGFWVGLVSPFLACPISNYFVGAVVGSIFSFSLFALLWKLAFRDANI